MVQEGKKKKLRSGFTTGTAAAAAARGAAQLLLTGEPPSQVQVRLINGEVLDVNIHSCVLNGPGRAECMVIKDAGDDPDVTNKAEIGARVSLAGEAQELLITAGEGVGRITKPGLELPPGEPAINPGPQRMIRESLDELRKAAGVSNGLHVEVFVPRGEDIARHTLNQRLGIQGGISILGTTGIVKPLSHAAYIATIDSSLAVARACGLDRVACTTGRRSERFGQELFPELPEEAFVQMGDYFAQTMKRAVQKGFSSIILVVLLGKAVKIAQGVPHTHAAKSRLALERLGEWVQEVCLDPGLAERVKTLNTAREAFFVLEGECPAIFDHIASRMVRHAQVFAGDKVEVRAVILDFEGGLVADSADMDTKLTLGQERS